MLIRRIEGMAEFEEQGNFGKRRIFYDLGNSLRINDPNPVELRSKRPVMIRFTIGLLQMNYTSSGEQFLQPLIGITWLVKVI